MSRRTGLILSSVFCLLAARTAAFADHIDGMTLMLSHGPGADGVTLDWTGGQPAFRIYRSSSPSAILDPSKLIATTDVRTFGDTPPAGRIFYYEIASPCVYNPPEICNGLDDDCDGTVDGPGSEATCSLPNAVARCAGGACAVASCNAGYGDCDGSPADGCETNTHLAQSTSPATLWSNDPDPSKDLKPGYARVTGIANCGGCGVTCDDGISCTTDLCVPVGTAGSMVGVCRHFNRSQCSEARCGGLALPPGTPPPGDAACTAPDSDGDGLSDPWETPQTDPYSNALMPVGIDLDCDGEISDSDQDMIYADPPVGPSVKDVYLAYDYMAANTAPGQVESESHAPLPEAVDAVIAAFAAQGITLHVDPVHHELPHSAVVYFPVAGPDACAAGDAVSFYALKSGNFDQRKRFTHKYMVFGHDSCSGGAPASGTTGIGEERGNDSIVSLGKFTYFGTPPQIHEKKKREQAGTLIHELGHNLGLDHGGPSEPCVPSPCPGDLYIQKPNFISSMNYSYQLGGIQRALTSGTTVPLDTFLPWRVDYSSDTLATLKESDLNESTGLTGAPSPRDRDIALYYCLGHGPYLAAGHGSVDWNCDGLLSPSAVSDVNNDGTLSTLDGANDWAHLDYRFQCQPTFADGVVPPSYVTPAELTLAMANDRNLRATILCQSDAECDDGNFCNGAETCSPATGACQPGIAPSCDDFNPCTVDTCSQAGNACLHDAAAANGLSCSLPNAVARCAGGACAVASCNAGYGDCDGSPADGCETNTHLAQSTSPAYLWTNDPDPNKDLKPGYARVTGIANCGGCGITCDDGVSCTTDLCVPVGSAGSTVGVCRHFDRGQCSEARCGGLVLPPGTPPPGDATCTAPDSDGDGLSDPWETQQADPYSGSMDRAGVDLNCNGAIDDADGDLIWHEPPSGTQTKDLYLEYDYMQAAAGEPSSHEPPPAAIDEVVSALARRGITAHIDPVHQALPHVGVLYIPVLGAADACALPGNTDFYSYKNNPANFDPRRKIGYRYFLFGHASCAASSPPGSDASGLAEILGNDAAVSLGTFTYTGTPTQIDAKRALEQAGTFMHELGHTFGLDHGGAQPPDPGSPRKPNYISSMNYFFQLSGILRAAAPGTITPLDQSIPRRVDFSPVVLDPVDENALDENRGLNSSTAPFDRDIARYYCAPRNGMPAPGPSQGPVDWDCDGAIRPVGVSQDLNNNGQLEVLPGFDDWAQMDFKFQCQPTFADGPQEASHVARNELTPGQATAFHLRADSTAYCDPGFDDCDGSPQNGCETSVLDDVNNCGGCGNLCAPGATCVGGSCMSSSASCDPSVPNSIWSKSLPGAGTPTAPPNDTAFNPGGQSISYIAEGSTLYALYNRDTGGHSAGTLKWSRSYTASIQGSPNPVLLRTGTEAVYVATSDGFVRALNADTGADLPGWGSFDTRRVSCPSDSLIATPAVQLWNLSNSSFRVSQSEDLVIVVTRTMCADTVNNRVIAIGASTGALKWVFNPNVSYGLPMNYGTAGCTVDYTNNLVYCGTDSAGLQHTLWAIRTTDGTRQWSRNAGAILNRPQLKGTRLYAATFAGVLRVFNVSDGSVVYTSVVGPSTILRDPLVISGGPFDSYILVTDTSGFLHELIETNLPTPGASAAWAATNLGGTVTTSPVADSNLGKAWVGMSNGTIHQVNLATGSSEARATVGLSAVSDPSVDIEGGGLSINRIEAATSSQVRRFCVPWTPGSIGTM